MSSTAYKDCLVYPYNSFKEKLRAMEDIKREIKKRYGKRKQFELFDLDNCIMAQYKAEKYNKYYH